MARHIIDKSIRSRIVSCGATQHYIRLRHNDADADAGVAGGPFVSDLALPHAQFTFRFKLKTLVRCSRSSVSKHIHIHTQIRNTYGNCYYKVLLLLLFVSLLLLTPQVTN